MARHSGLPVARLVGAALAVAMAIAGAGFRAPLSAADQKLAPCEYEGVERVVAVADVHGAYDRLLEIMKAAGLLDERHRWAGGRAHFVQLGDLVDRGADSRKVIDFLRGLVGPAKRAGGAVHVLLGNHEAARLLGDVRYVHAGEYKAFVDPDSNALRERFIDSVMGVDRGKLLAETPLGWVELRMAYGRTGEYGRWLRSLDTVIRVNDVVFVHGGLSPEVAAKPCNVINETVRRELTGDLDKTRAAPSESLVASAKGPLWYRGLTQEGDEFSVAVDEILKRQGAKAIVIGHSVQKEGRIQARFGGKVFALDTGMQAEYAQNGRASALEIQNGVFTAIYVDSREVLLDRTNGK